jgi:predicted anti-sigma-YlaC factor YlaD
MFCDQILESVEAIAAGDLAEDAAVTAHLASCAGCRAALADAREVERLLRGRRAPAAPPQFTSRVLTRIRRERWRREQVFDTGFNASLALIGVAILGGAWFLLDWSGLLGVPLSVAAGLGVVDSAIETATRGAITVARSAAPSVPLYAAAVGLLAGALGLWWWAERDLTL